MKKEKRHYEAPKVQKVRLVLKNAVLGTCHSSPTLTPQQGDGFGGGVITCSQVPIGCWDGPGY